MSHASNTINNDRKRKREPEEMVVGTSSAKLDTGTDNPPAKRPRGMSREPQDNDGPAPQPTAETGTTSATVAASSLAAGALPVPYQFSSTSFGDWRNVNLRAFIDSKSLPGQGLPLLGQALSTQVAEAETRPFTDAHNHVSGMDQPRSDVGADEDIFGFPVLGTSEPPFPVREPGTAPQLVTANVLPFNEQPADDHPLECKSNPPQTPMPKESEAQRKHRGEEDESIIYTELVKLHVMGPKDWQYQGDGRLTVNVHRNDEKRARFIFRLSTIAETVLLNARLFKEMGYKRCGLNELTVTLFQEHSFTKYLFEFEEGSEGCQKLVDTIADRLEKLRAAEENSDPTQPANGASGDDRDVSRPPSPVPSSTAEEISDPTQPTNGASGDDRDVSRPPSPVPRSTAEENSDPTQPANGASGDDRDVSRPPSPVPRSTAATPVSLPPAGPEIATTDVVRNTLRDTLPVETVPEIAETKVGDRAPLAVTDEKADVDPAAAHVHNPASAPPAPPPARPKRTAARHIGDTVVIITPTAPPKKSTPRRRATAPSAPPQKNTTNRKGGRSKSTPVKAKVLGTAAQVKSAKAKTTRRSQPPVSLLAEERAEAARVCALHNAQRLERRINREQKRL